MDDILFIGTEIVLILVGVNAKEKTNEGVLFRIFIF